MSKPSMSSPPECPQFILEQFAIKLSAQFCHHGKLINPNLSQEELDKFIGTEVLNWVCTGISYRNGRIDVDLTPNKQEVEFYFHSNYPKQG